MLFLTRSESACWREIGREVVARQMTPFPLRGRIREKLIPCFRCYAGGLLMSHGLTALGRKWFQEGVVEEEEGLFFNGFVNSFLERQKGRFLMPEQPFVDPRPFMHFASVPVLKRSREEFVRQACDSLPRFPAGVRIMDIGCGNGALTADLVQRLQQIGKASEIGQILLVDPSPAMVELAVRTVGEVFPPSAIRGVKSSVQEFSLELNERYDLAVSSFAFHHVPYETKLFNLRKLSPWVDHFVLFELDSNNDLPELDTPELALSVYQLYGRVIDWVFSHDAPVELAIAAVDNFLMAEAVSMLSLPRGKRTDYHALRWQWHDLFRHGLGPEFTCLCDITTLAEDYLDLFTMHYGRA
ncbi:MAG: class I SAM-dependent methyltransferase [Acidobacteriota bacterium]